MKRIDANIILRYLLDDHEDLSARAAAIIDAEEVFASTEVVCEVVYVLSGVYEIARGEIAEQLTQFICLNGITVSDAAVLSRALSAYAEESIDFVDAILFAHHDVRADQIATFDKKLAKLLGC